MDEEQVRRPPPFPAVRPSVTVTVTVTFTVTRGVDEEQVRCPPPFPAVRPSVTVTVSVTVLVQSCLLMWSAVAMWLSIQVLTPEIRTCDNLGSTHSAPVALIASHVCTGVYHPC